MNLELAEIAALLPFEKRYELRQRRWYDGPYESWVAFDRVLEREVVLNRAYPSFTAIPRFIKTAKAASTLRHPNLLPVFDLGVFEGVVPFYTTPSVPALPLKLHLWQLEREPGPINAPFPLKPLVAIVRDACGAVEHAHRHGFLHLDLHSESLLVEEGFREVFLVGDWEEAAARGDETKGETCMAFRPPYTSPEQIDEKGTGIGPATDVFGLGGILHVILFGTPPTFLPGRTKRGGPDPGCRRAGLRPEAARHITPPDRQPTGSQDGPRTDGHLPEVPGP